ncbi:MAG: glucose-6-phosphate isomerase, partial [Burkholderiales bacterium]
MSLVSQSSAWQALAAHANKLGKLRILDLFAADPHRQTNFSLELDGLYLDFSKQAATPQTLALLLGLARQTEVETWRERMFSGEAINTSENRAVLHMALRADLDAAAFDTAAFNAQTRNAPSPMHERARQIRDCQARMGAFVHRARAGELRGTSNQSITDIVNLGIGGSDLGPRLVSEALAKPVTGKPRVHYVANIDPAELDEVLCNIDPKNTLFIIA